MGVQASSLKSFHSREEKGVIEGFEDNVPVVREFFQDGCQMSDFRDGIDCMLESHCIIREAMEFINVSQLWYNWLNSP